MLHTYYKIAVRSLLKSKLFSLLNLSGLALGLAVALALALYIGDERSFDRFHQNHGRIYRAGVTATFDGKTQRWGNAPNIVGPAMKAGIAAVAQQTRWLKHNYGSTAFTQAGDKKFAEKKMFWADSTLFDVFDIDLFIGNPKTALQGVNKIVLSESTARRYFEDQNPLGQAIKVDNKYTLEVSGVYRDLPPNSSLEAALIGTIYNIDWAMNLVWSNASFETFLLLQPGADPKSVEQQMAAVLANNVPEDRRWFSLWLQPLADIHLGSAGISNTYMTAPGDPGQLGILSALAVVILLIACINYMNLSTARSQQRFREVGINKAMGATRRQLARRFYLETGLLVLAAIVAGLVLLFPMLPVFNMLADKNLGMSDLITPAFGIGLLGLGFLLTVVAGVYPARYLTSYSPKNLLNAAFRSGAGAGMLRRVLVVTQFVASIALISCTLIFSQQLRFIQNKKLGFEPEQVLAVTTMAAESRAQIESLADACRNLSDVAQVCRTQTWPGFGGSGHSISKPSNPKESFFIRTSRIGPEFMEVLDLKLLAGSSLPVVKAPTDSTIQIVINQTAAGLLGYTPEEAVGKKVQGIFNNDHTEIAGVVQDFHFESLHQPIGPYAFGNQAGTWQPYLLVKLRTGNVPETMRKIEAAFQQALPNAAFEYTFLDEHLDTLYRTEHRNARVVMALSALAILIACMGLFGLAAFTAERRTKEIGVRKVLGASVGSLVGLMAGDFMKLVLVALVVSAPIAWYVMHLWLSDFAYHIDISWWVFAVAGMLALVLAFLTVSTQSIKAALVNPVTSLRSQ